MLCYVWECPVYVSTENEWMNVDRLELPLRLDSSSSLPRPHRIGRPFSPL